MLVQENIERVKILGVVIGASGRGLGVIVIEIITLQDNSPFSRLSYFQRFLVPCWELASLNLSASYMTYSMPGRSVFLPGSKIQKLIFPAKLIENFLRLVFFIYN